MKREIINILSSKYENPLEIYEQYFSESVDSLNEAHVRVKRKYGNYAEKKAYTGISTRLAMMEFLFASPKSQEEMDEFLNGIEESKGKKPDAKWFENNQEYFTKKNGMWRITERGKKLYSSHIIEEEKKGIYYLDLED